MKNSSRLILATVVLPLVIALLLAEIVLRLTYSEVEADGSYWGMGTFEAFEATGYRHTPGFRGRAYRAGEFDVSIEIHEYGLRESHLESQRQYPETILVLGDSFSFGLGVEEAEGFPALLQDAFNVLDIGVINGSQTGYGVAQEAAFGIYLGEILQPNQILLCLSLGSDIANDFMDMRNATSIDVVDGYRLPKDRWLADSPLDYLRTHSYLVMRLGEIQRQLARSRMNSVFDKAVQDDPEAVARPTLQAIQALYDYCAARGIAFSIVSVSSKAGPNQFNAIVAADIRAKGIPFLDLEESDFNEDDFFRQDGHWNAAGHQKAARHILRFLGEPALPPDPPNNASAG